MNFKSLASGAALAVLAVAASSPAGAVVITNGAYSVGINDYGQLLSQDDSGANVGFRRNSDGAEVIYAGAERDTWGVGGAYADEQNSGSAGLLTSSLSSTATTALSTVTTGDFSVVQAFSFVSENILAIKVSLTNISGGDLAAVFQRLADFDVDPEPDVGETVIDPFGNTAENTTYGFDDASTLNPWGFPLCFACSATYDAGAGLRANLGNLGAGQTTYFTYYYGLGAGSDDLAVQMQAAGAKDILVVTGSDGTLSAAMGLAVPEPSTWAMMLLGFFGLGSMLRRRQAALA